MSKEKTAKLNVSLYENHLTQEKDDYIAKVQFIGTRTNESIAREIVAQRSEFRYDTILNILNICDEVKRDSLVAGYIVVDGVTQMRPSVIGRFKGEKAHFDPEIHSLHVSISPTSEMRKTMKAVKVIVKGLATTGPVVNRVLDMRSATENDVLTPGGILKIEGHNLRIIGDNTLEIGAWFVNVLDPDQRIRVEERDIADNAPSHLTLNVPQLDPGQYLLEVVTQSTSNTKEQTKMPRTYRFESVLTVA